ncbi:hypothetical protein K0M31_017041 [Melipona bicolor]|uniref:Secreted protein n=1 Tax=Melipona bicolor TaxID=60889 RepID=A0AA40FDH4_9HYME|nr:hypothetical protein K0M31_017041 [Melipona bicolor]
MISSHRFLSPFLLAFPTSLSLSLSLSFYDFSVPSSSDNAMESQRDARVHVRVCLSSISRSIDRAMKRSRNATTDDARMEKPSPFRTSLSLPFVPQSPVSS